jgi:hypothetical protein
MAEDTKLADGFGRYNQFVDAFHTESDRGVAVLSMCVLEEIVREGVAKRLGPYKERLMPTLAPRGRWSTLADCAWMLGVLSAADRADLLILVDIRNRFAHRALQDLSFDHPDVVHQVGRLKVSERFDLEHDGEMSNRTEFMNAVAALYFFVKFRLERHEVLPEAEDLRFEVVYEVVDK